MKYHDDLTDRHTDAWTDVQTHAHRDGWIDERRTLCLWHLW